MNRGPTVAQTPLLPVERYTGNCLIKPPSSYFAHAAAVVEPQRCRYDAAVIGYRPLPQQQQQPPPPPPPPYHHFRMQDWYHRTPPYWHRNGGSPLAEKANFAAYKHGAPLIQVGAVAAGKYRNGGTKKYVKKVPEQPKKNDGSDESSGTASENSLPRIIKPRKRRKKERKPQPQQTIVVVPAVVDNASPVVVVVDSDEQDGGGGRQQVLSSGKQPTKEQLPFPDGAAEVLQLPFDAVKLTADIKAVSLEDVSTCQCACCDPVGNVWDVGRRCFSPSLTRPEPTRRSWSESFPKADAAVGKQDTGRARTHSLEVSSEIVTSHNGHRDIEIKFFTMPIGNQ